MEKIIQIFKLRWLTILLSVGLLVTSIIVFQQKEEIKYLKHEVFDLENKISTLENKKEKLQIELDNCNSYTQVYENIWLSE